MTRELFVLVEGEVMTEERDDKLECPEDYYSLDDGCAPGCLLHLGNPKFSVSEGQYSHEEFVKFRGTEFLINSQQLNAVAYMLLELVVFFFFFFFNYCW